METAAERTLELLADESLRREFGRRGRETVAERFLFTRSLRQYIGWFHDLAYSSL